MRDKDHPKAALYGFPGKTTNPAAHFVWPSPDQIAGQRIYIAASSVAPITAAQATRGCPKALAGDLLWCREPLTATRTASMTLCAVSGIRNAPDPALHPTLLCYVVYKRALDGIVQLLPPKEKVLANSRQLLKRTGDRFSNRDLAARPKALVRLDSDQLHIRKPCRNIRRK